MAIDVGHVVRQRAEGESIFLGILTLPEHFFNEIAAAHVMNEVAEFLAAEGVIAKILNNGATVGVGVRFLDLVVGQAWETVFNERENVRSPEEIDDLFVGQNRIGERSSAAKNQRHQDRDRASKIQDSISVRRAATWAQRAFRCDLRIARQW